MRAPLSVTPGRRQMRVRIKRSTTNDVSEAKRVAVDERSYRCCSIASGLYRDHVLLFCIVNLGYIGASVWTMRRCIVGMAGWLSVLSFGVAVVALTVSW